MRGVSSAVAGVHPISSYCKLLLVKDDRSSDLVKSLARSTLSLKLTWLCQAWGRGPKNTDVLRETRPTFSHFSWHPAECSQQRCYHFSVVLGEEQSARAQPTHCLLSAKRFPRGIHGQQPLSSLEEQGCSSAIPYAPPHSTSGCMRDTDATVKLWINISDQFSSDRIDFWSRVSLFGLRTKTAGLGCLIMKLIMRRHPVNF